jgi:hypothetical protein
MNAGVINSCIHPTRSVEARYKSDQLLYTSDTIASSQRDPMFEHLAELYSCDKLDCPKARRIVKDRTSAFAGRQPQKPPRLKPDSLTPRSTILQ